jgi:hypothetical protein
MDASSGKRRVSCLIGRKAAILDDVGEGAAAARRRETGRGSRFGDGVSMTGRLNLQDMIHDRRKKTAKFLRGLSKSDIIGEILTFRTTDVKNALAVFA